MVGWGEIELLIPGSHSLKDKRQVLSSMMQRISKHFNVSLCEVEGQGSWQHSRMEAAWVGTSQTAVEETFAALLRTFEGNPSIQVLSSTYEVL